jgi:hypothetical protein
LLHESCVRTNPLDYGLGVVHRVAIHKNDFNVVGQCRQYDFEITSLIHSRDNDADLGIGVGAERNDMHRCLPVVRCRMISTLPRSSTPRKNGDCWSRGLGVDQDGIMLARRVKKDQFREL